MACHKSRSTAGTSIWRIYHLTSQHDRLLSFLHPALRNEDLFALCTVGFLVYSLYFEAALRGRKPVEARFAFDRMKALSDPGRPEINLSEARLLVLERKYDGAIAYHPAITRDGLKGILGMDIRSDLIGRLHALGLIGAGPRSP